MGGEKGGQWDNAVTREHNNLDTKAYFQIARHGCKVWSSVLQLINCFSYVKDDDNESFLETKCIKTKRSAIQNDIKTQNIYHK